MNKYIEIEKLRGIQGIGEKTMQRIYDSLRETPKVKPNVEPLKLNSINLGDCLDLMWGIKDHSIDLVLADVPYGTTACKWDTVIPLDEMWLHLNRVIKPNGAIVMTASQPFTSHLVMSNWKWFKYAWVWAKNRATGHVHSKNKPMKQHEDVLIFCEGNTLHKGQSENRMEYYPQGLIELPIGTKRRARNDAGDSTVMSKRKSHKETEATHTGYPTSIIKFTVDVNNGQRLHPTQKPVALFEYLIKTYTKEGEIVLDFTSGSGTTAIAAINTQRNYILIEKHEPYYVDSLERVHEHTSNPNV